MRHWNKNQKNKFYQDDKNELKIFFGSKILLVILSILLLAVLSAFTRDFSHKGFIDSEVGGLQDEINDLESERDNNLALIEYYDSDEFLKQEAKKNLELKEDGERIMVIADDELDKYLLHENEVGNLKKTENNDIDIENINEEKFEKNKLERQFNIWWNYFFS